MDPSNGPAKGISGIAGFGLNFGTPSRNSPPFRGFELSNSPVASQALDPVGFPRDLTELFSRYDEACQACRVELDLISEYHRWVDAGIQRRHQQQHDRDRRKPNPSEVKLGRETVYQKMVAQGEIVKGLLREIRVMVKAERAKRRQQMELDEFSLISSLKGREDRSGGGSGEEGEGGSGEEAGVKVVGHGPSDTPGTVPVVVRQRERGGAGGEEVGVGVGGDDEEEELLRQFKEAESAFSDVNSAYSDAVHAGIQMRRRNEQKTTSLYLRLVAQSEQVQGIAKKLNEIQQRKKQRSRE